MSPSTHQDGPKVPESWPAHELWRLKWDPEKTLHANPSAERTDLETETYIPVSALLSDEVVGAASDRFEERQKVEGFEFSWPGSFMREALEAAIEQVGGGQGGR